ncbi:MAG TPA: EVE domain-containing protein [Gammaproteobacteria bacterium]|nr:EVE domain-containing protein [Gammaproteobacteria bacterium]
MNYWLFKSEPATFSIDDLAASPGKRTCWDGVRNYQARNFIRDDMHKGDLVLFYHSSCDVTGVAGVAEIVRESYVDHTAFDPADPHYDAKSKAESPRWFMVDIKLKRKLKRIITLAELREHGTGALKGLALLNKGNRLSILPVSSDQWKFILSME